LSAEVSYSRDVERVLRQPRRVWLPGDALALSEWLSPQLRTTAGSEAHAKWLAIGGREGERVQLRNSQAIAIWECYQNRGLFTAIPVGGGKTLVSFLLAWVLSSKRPILFIPASLRDKTLREFDKLMKYWLTAVPLPTIETYSQLSLHTSVDMLTERKPDLLIFDEADKLRAIDRSVAKRVGRYVDMVRDKCVIATMTGTIARKSLRDYAHLALWGLREKAPVPLSDDLGKEALGEWCAAIDEDSVVGARLRPGALLRFAEQTNVPIVQNELPSVGEIERAREGFRRRFSETPGCVVIDESECDQPICIRFREPPDDPAIEAHYKHFRETDATPEGILMADPLQKYNYDDQSGKGFYYLWWNEEGFRTCLGKHRNSARNILSSTELEILHGFEHTTGSGMTLAKVVVKLRRERFASSFGTYVPGTDSVLYSSNASSQSMLGYAISVLTAKPRALTMTTAPAVSGGSYVSPAIGLWECWEIVLRAYPKLYDILEEAVSAAQPPKDWLKARYDWACFVREEIKLTADSARPLDTEFAVARAYPDNQELAIWQYERERPRDNGKPYVPNSVPCWVSASVVLEAWRIVREEWLANGYTGLIWCRHAAFCSALSSVSGIPYFGAKGERIGADGKPCKGETIERFVADALARGQQPPPAILSVDSNMRGRNLQAYHVNLLVGWEQAATRAEQLMGRTHRAGQNKPVFFDVLLTSGATIRSFQATMSEADWVQAVQGHTQKILKASVDWSLVSNVLSGPAATQYRWA